MLTLGVLSYEIHREGRPRYTCAVLEAYNRTGQRYTHKLVRREKPVMVFEVEGPAVREPTVTFHFPTPFPYKTNKAVPWVYDVKMDLPKGKSIEDMTLAVDKTENKLEANISQSQGIT